MASHIFIFVPGFGQIITATTFLSTHALRDHLHSKGMGTGISTLSFPDIAELRGMVTGIWYDTYPQSDHILFVDSDMGFPPDHVVDMLLFNEPIVGTIYRQRQENISWAGSGNGGTHTERKGNFVRVEGVGFGCTLVKRMVIDLMTAQMPGIWDYRIDLHPAADMIKGAGSKRIFRGFEKLDIPERGLISEDLAFCIRAGMCGVPTWAHIGSQISHVGPYDYRGRYLDYVEEAARQQSISAQQKALDEMMAAQAAQQGLQLTVLPQQELPEEWKQAAE